MDSQEDSKHIQELLVEHEQLRQEILHNETLSIQVLAAITVFVPSLLALAFSSVIQEDGIKAILVFLAEAVAFVGLSQSLDRESAIFLIASYLRTFTESKLQELKWETRLFKLRQIQPSLVYGDFSNFHVWIYIFFIVASCTIGCWYTFQAFLSKQLAFGIVTNVIIILITTWLLKLKIQDYQQLSRHRKPFDSIWARIKAEENQNATVEDRLLQ